MEAGLGNAVAARSEDRGSYEIVRSLLIARRAIGSSRVHLSKDIRCTDAGLLGR